MPCAWVVHGLCMPLFAAFLAAAQPVLAADEPPPALVEATEQASGVCRDLGGTPRILDSYETIRDLNGDGRDDFVTDLANLQCAGAWGAFCGPGGCPVTAWLSRPDKTYDRLDLGPLQAFAVRDNPLEDLPVLVARYDATRCGAESVTACTRTWRFTTNQPPEPPADFFGTTVAEAPEPAEPPSPPAAASAPAPDVPEPRKPGPPPARPQELHGWTLRNVPGGSPVALGAGTGMIRSLAAFCLGGQPFLAVEFLQKPSADMVTLGFDFSQGPVEASAGHEETAGGAYVIDLEGGPLAARLAGRDSKVDVDLDGQKQGALSLAGSTKAIRSALADCPGG